VLTLSVLTLSVRARRSMCCTMQSFGRLGSQLVTVCVFTLNTCSLVAYINIMADVLSSVAGSIIPPGAEPSRNIMMTGEACSPTKP
jgi:hypothetical protein